jgi:hypothetical protein
MNEARDANCSQQSPPAELRRGSGMRCRFGHSCPFAIISMLEGNTDTVTIPAKKTAVQAN